MRFDIILPTVLRPSLGAAIESVIAQTHTEWHLWIGMDGFMFKPEEVPDIIDVYKDRRITFIGVQKKKDKKSFGFKGAMARNLMILKSGQETANPVIAYIDDDDIWLPNHLTTIERYGRLNDKANMFRSAGQEMRLKRKSPRSKEKRIKLGQVNYTDPLTVGMAHTREIFELTNYWQECDNHDHVLWQEMLESGGVPEIGEDITYRFNR
jgi:glycosyltransferase involved in cell wall biosynthesis